ncbi:MAG: hypothetical protein LLF98_06430 [Clostridium sp.]|uniref:hypothetical protein n=1 Tax=Clostridium sp. TaxID=1506 RepID=UPI0025BBCDD3|nr:hypothetical protein [Clostridium sp.]MCE5220902.1 hypothetical protein [Clostridium sp.]
MNQKWYEKNLAIILLLIFFFPVGLFLMWKYSRWNKIAKIVISIFFGIVLLSNMGSKKTSQTATTKTETATIQEQPKEKTEEEKAAEVAKQKADEEAKAKADAEAKAAAEKEAKKIKAGTYKIGTDIPAGEYLVIAKSIGYVECAKDSKGQLDSIIFNDNLTSGSDRYVTLNEGEYFKLTGAEMYPVSEAPSIIPKDGIYKDGMYKVGKDIPAGEYKVKLTGGMGYTEVTTNSRHQLDSIVSNENVQADTYLTVQDGQYLKMTGVQIQK